MTSRQIEVRLRTGRLHSVHRGVYAVGRPELTDRGRWLAGMLAAGSGAVLSHRSAAALWGVRPWHARVVELTCRSGSRKPGLIVHRSILQPDETTHRYSVPVTRVARTLIDLAEAVPRADLERAVHQAYRLRVYDAVAVQRALERHRRRPGAGLLSRILADHPEGSGRTRSPLEVAMLRICRDHDLPAPLVNVVVEGRERDFYWPDHGLVVETDGAGSHLTPYSFEDDRERDTFLREAGYEVRRFTYRQITERPDWVAARLEAALTYRSRMSNAGSGSTGLSKKPGLVQSKASPKPW